MARSPRLVGILALALASGGCATFGTNVEGNFSCRAPKGDCAPSHVIDERAMAQLGSDQSAETGPVRQRRGVAAGDPTRTGERTLRVVFPAHIDEAGNLHEEAAAWAVIEHPRWIAELRTPAADESAPPLMRELARRLRAARDAAAAGLRRAAAAAAATNSAPEAPTEADSASPFSASPPEPALPVASPLVLPSPAREAATGAPAPAAEGFDMFVPPHDRTSRPLGRPAYPTAEAITNARKAAASKASVPEPASPEAVAADPAANQAEQR